MSNSHPWWTLNLGDGISASVACEQIKDEFHACRAAAGQEDAMAVFTSRSEGDLHCEVIAYFSPGGAALARRLGAVPCAAPAPAGLELLAGGTDCWNALFAIRAPE